MSIENGINNSNRNNNSSNSNTSSNNNNKNNNTNNPSLNNNTTTTTNTSNKNITISSTANSIKFESLKSIVSLHLFVNTHVHKTFQEKTQKAISFENN